MATPMSLLLPHLTASVAVAAVAAAAAATSTRYCQGMNYCVKHLLHVCKADEARAFRLLGLLTTHHGMGMLYQPNLRGLRVCFSILSHLMFVHLPDLAAHLAGQGVAIDMFTSSWFMTLFTNFDTLGPHVVNAVLMLFLVDGWKVRGRGR